jgi:hypothetical protein
MLTIQHAIYAWEGSINKFLVDDKGMLILCVFGASDLKPNGCLHCFTPSLTGLLYKSISVINSCRTSSHVARR